ncbi:MAG: alpha/beta hydrolase [Gammaproteobacteria bacterium]|nr:alpha/beta hydrolase [Gammaproteobacteria bacterium]
MSYNIDPELSAILEVMPTLEFDDPIQARAGIAEMSALMGDSIDETGVEIEDRNIPGPAGALEVPIRIYKPRDLSATTAGLLYIHGGGFVVGNLDSEHAGPVSVCRELGIVVVSTGYRKAPEDPYPAGLEDCYASLQWLHTNTEALNVDPARIAVRGGSAGGGLTASLVLLARDRGGPAICFQYLGIPELDDRLATVSMTEFTDTPLWNRPNAINSWKYYLGNDYSPGGENVPYTAAPARASIDDLRGLPAAYVSTMEFDPLRDEGIEYALKLLQAGVNVELHSYPGTFHGSELVIDAAVSQRGAAEGLEALRRGLKLAG